MEPNGKKSILQKLIAILLIVGPGLFCVGYTIGTGSVTSMIVAGSKYGTTLLWIVALSCFFSGILMEAYGRFAIVTGRTALNAFRTELPAGTVFALVTMLMLIAGQWCCLSGLVGLSSNALYESVNLLFPGIWEKIAANGFKGNLSIAILVLGVLYTIFWFGNYSRIETFLAALVTLLALSFLVTMFLAAPSYRQIAEGLIPRIPNIPGAPMLAAAMVGTTLAAPTFVVRPMLVLSKGWSINDRKRQIRDVIVSALTMFVISGSIMCVSVGVIYNRGGAPIEHVLDMVETLRPIAGKGAVLVFLLGFVSAGLSSILPIAMIAGYLLGDFRNGKIDIKAPIFRVLTGMACLIGLSVPILGANPVVAQILTQVSQVFVLPLVIIGIAVLVNRKKLMGKYRAGILLNLGLAASFFFAVLISIQAVQALIVFFNK